MTAIVASSPPASATKRLRMTRSRTLSSAPPMTMTVPSATMLHGSDERYRARIATDAARRVEPPCRACAEIDGRASRPIRMLAARPGPAAERGRMPMSTSRTVVDRGRRAAARASSGGRCGARRRASTTAPDRSRSRPDRRDVRGHRWPGLIARGEAGRRRRPGLLGRRPDLAQRRRPVPPDRARSCPTSTRRGCCRCSRRGRSCRGTSPGSSGAAATILLLLWTIHWAYRRRPLTTAVIVARPGLPVRRPTSTPATSTCS